MATPLNKEAEIIEALREKNRLVTEQVASMEEGFQNMMAGAQAELDSNNSIIDALTSLAQWSE